MVGPSVSRLEPSVSHVRHVKMQALIIDHLISKRCGGIYSGHIEYDLPQDEGYESRPITFRQYLENMTSKTGKYAGDKLFHAISRDNNPTTVHFIYLPNHKIEASQVLNGAPCIITEELLAKPKDFITRSGIERATMFIWDK